VAPVTIGIIVHSFYHHHHHHHRRRRRHYYYYYYYYRYSALGPVWAETRAPSGDWYSSGKLHPGQLLKGRLPLLSPAFF
jgi:hypothetical protein